MPARRAGPRVSVIVPAWNVQGVIDRCLDSVERQEVAGGLETIVIENGSVDRTRMILADRRIHGRVVLNGRNVGFAASNNQGAALANGDILLFLNADTELLDPDTVEALARAVEDPGVGIAGPMLLNPDGTIQPTCAAHPSVLRAALLGFGLHRVMPSTLRRALAPEFWSHGESIDTGWLNFAALAVRADLFRALGGCWDTEYGEDEDLAYRSQLLGYRVRYVNAARVMHVGNHSFGQHRSDIERASRVARAELTFLRTHYTEPRAAAIRLLTGAGYAIRALVLAALRRPGRAAIYRAMAEQYATFEPAPARLAVPGNTSA